MGPVGRLNVVERLDEVERLNVIPSVVTALIPEPTSGCPLTSHWGGCKMS
jgi:hypothetical protein